MAKSTNTSKYQFPWKSPGYLSNPNYNFSFSDQDSNLPLDGTSYSSNSNFNFGFAQDGNLTLDDTLQSLLPAAAPTIANIMPADLVNPYKDFQLDDMFPGSTGGPVDAASPGFFSQVGSGIKSALGLSPTHTLEELQAMGPEKLEALKAQNGERLLNRQAFGQTLQGLNSLMSGYFGYQGMKQAQDALDFQKASWAKNYAAQRTSYNNELAANKALGAKIAGTYSDDALAKYMAEKGIK